MVEGPQLVIEVIDSGLRVTEVFGDPPSLAELGRQRSLGPDTDVYEVDPSVLASALDPVSPRPLAAVVDRPEASLDDIVAGDGPVVVAVELRDPGNLGTVIRTAEAAGAAGLVVVGDTVDRFSPKVVRASAGSLFRLPTTSVDDGVELFDQLRRVSRPVVATVLDAEAPAYDAVDLTRAAIVIGNEPHGLAATLVDAADHAVTIPMAPTVESLNVGAATSVLCFEAARQRREIRWTATAGGPKVSTMKPDETSPPRTVPT